VFNYKNELIVVDIYEYSRKNIEN